MIKEFGRRSHAQECGRVRHINALYGTVMFALWCLMLLVVLAPPVDAKQVGAQDNVGWLLDDGGGEEHIDLSLPLVATPEELRKAMDHYKNGRYRLAAQVLERVAAMELPDGQNDFVNFALAECYRALGLREVAEERYRWVAEQYPASEKVPAVLFRLLQYAAGDRNVALCDSIHGVWKASYLQHPLYASTIYEVALLRYRINAWGEAINLLKNVPQNSSRFSQAQFLTALCLYEVKEMDKCLLVLDHVRKRASDYDLASEASILIGDIYYNKDNPQTALRHYQMVSQKATRYEYAFVKSLRCMLDLEQAEKARDLARDYASKQSESEYFFEIVSILEQAYEKLGDESRAEKAAGMVFRQVANARLSFETYEELNAIGRDLGRFRALKQQAHAAEKQQLAQSIQSDIDRLEVLEKKLLGLLRDISPKKSLDKEKLQSDLAVLSYLGTLKNKMTSLEDSVYRLQKEIHSAKVSAESENLPDSLLPPEIRNSVLQRERVRTMLNEVEREYSVVSDEFVSSGRLALDEQSPAKYIDWSFMKYLRKKEKVLEMNAALASRDTSKEKGDSLAAKGKKVAKIFGTLDRDKLEQEIDQNRAELINHAQTMLAFFPRNRSNPQILFRLAELYYDNATDEFDTKLRDYERRLAANTDTAGLAFPEYDLSKVISTYNEIINLYPRSSVADDALFYKALALQKLGQADNATDILIALTKRYPESEFFVEANMLIGRYYFENPTINDNTGYKLAEEAFREVLYYRDHPQFVQALYNLGWCYYMQDQYEEAIAVFKYLIEEVELDFDPNRSEEKQAVNPLLRGEAIDYIAISFDEDGRLEDAISFLELVGNIDYSAMVLVRIGELREEVRDYGAAIDAYRRVLAEYPNSSIAPDASAKLIKMYDMQGMKTLALEEREGFFERYARGSQWAELMKQKGLSIQAHADSMAIANGLFVADLMYRRAEMNNTTEDFRRAAQNYKRVVDKYPKDSRTVDARWNLAVILDQKLAATRQAYETYVAFSQLASAQKERREQAALNAIALVQKTLPPDSAVVEGKLGPSAVKLIEAVRNYATVFPDGGSYGEVMLTMGALYFNRKMFSSAIEVYAEIAKKGPGTEDYYEALFMQGQCFFGQENWPAASKVLAEVVEGTSEYVRREEARKLLLQSEFLYAKQFLASGDFEKASSALLSIEDRFPGSEYGDVVLFNAAESFEKMDKWEDAAKSYHRLVANYPDSKLAPDALFNAAGDFQRIEKFGKAAEAYETLVSRYPDSEKAKDGLFNLSFCYEKMGRADLMAQANERYTALYPGEKDAKAMLLRAGDFYLRSGTYEKARNVYRNFVRRFPNEPEAVQALFMVGKAFLDEKDTAQALSSFEQAEQHNTRLASGSGTENSFHASEAAFEIAKIHEAQCRAIVFDDASGLAEAQKEKSRHLNEAVKAFTRVVKYQSPKMFEAAFTIGDLYDSFARTWQKQELPKLDPIKSAVKRKEILEATSALLQKTFVPYQKVLDLAKQFDSLGVDQKRYVELAGGDLARNYSQAGMMLVEAVGEMYNAPLPEGLASRPLHYFQYRHQLIEATLPLKNSARTYFLNASQALRTYGFEEQANACLSRYAEIEYRVGEDYEKIVQRILEKDYEVPEDIDAVEREDLEFQLEDIVFELQDKALFAYEDAMNRLRGTPAQNTQWYARIMRRLARLSPDLYGADLFVTHNVTTDESWAMRTDSVTNWVAPQAGPHGWSAAKRARTNAVPEFPVGSPLPVWHAMDSARTVFARKDFFLNGAPRSAVVYLAVGGAYKLFINGTLASADPDSARDPMKIDSISGIGELFRGGDNSVGMQVTASESGARSLCLGFSFLIDTTQHFESKREVVAKTTTANPQPSSPEASGQTTQEIAEVTTEDTVRQISSPTSSDTLGVAGDLGSRWGGTREVFQGDVRQAITDYQNREQQTQQEIRRERLELQKLRIKQEHLDARIEGVKDEIKRLKENPSEEAASETPADDDSASSD